MGLLADLTAYAVQRSAPRTARYGDRLHLDGSDLPEPVPLVVPTRRGAVRCRVHRTRGEAVGTYVHLHGGAFVMRYPQMDDFFARFVAARAGLVVVSVDYDVAPQVRYPVAQEQAHDVLAWVARHHRQLRVDAARTTVGGFSAGGNLAASACLQARDLGSVAPDAQLLVVPSLDVAEPPETKAARSPGGMVDVRLLRLVRSTYFRDAGRRAEPYASPLRATDLGGLPPTMVVTAGRDTLRHEGDAYAARLREAGVDVEHVVVPGADHYVLDGDVGRAEALMGRMAAHLRGAG